MPNSAFPRAVQAPDERNHQEIESNLRALESEIFALRKAQAVIEFDMNGIILFANDNFLEVMGYRLDEVVGKHHRIFVDEAFAASAEYREFWASLNRGEYESKEYKRLGKGGKAVWIQASYNPILDFNGRPVKVVKYATDVTKRKNEANVLGAKVDDLLEVVHAAASGDLTRMIAVRGDDAIGRMGEGLSDFFADLRNSVANIADSACAVGAASDKLKTTSVQLSTSATETCSRVNLVVEASTEVNSNIQGVAGGANELSASIREIAKNADAASEVATRAVAAAEATNRTITKLGQSSAEIGKVVKVITSVAQQTNLLALNATIEAARAGEAGRGFAVVAHEVKELAKETAVATEDIAQKIETIQKDTQSAVTAIREITTIIDSINDIQTTIASAVEEQTMTTNEISRNVTQAAGGSQEITANVAHVAAAADETTSGAGHCEHAALELSTLAQQLQQLVSRFNFA